MKVLITDCTETFGGAFELALTLVRFLKRIPGIEPVLVSGQAIETLKARVPADIPFYRVAPGTCNVLEALDRWPNKLAVAYKLLRYELPAMLHLMYIILRERADVVHLNNMLNSQIYGVLAAWLTRRPCVCCHRDYEHDSAFMRVVERKVSVHVACSKLIAQDIRKLGVPEHKIEFIWDGTDGAQFSPQVVPADLEKLFAVPRGRTIFAIFGRVVEWKGQEIFLRAAERVVRTIPGAHALVVGGPSDGGPEFVTQLRELAQHLQIADRVTFTGFRTDVAPMMRACDVLVHASLRPEPFGTAILEGMACGLPYVAMNEGGPAEMVEDGVTGILVPPSNPALMADALIRLLSDPQLRDGMGAAARRRFLDHFSSEVFAQRHAELYRRLKTR